ncbi:BTAD domain-containing putative transcriptional regulator [Streptomyces sp. NPDC015130]|uniref:AfsR/SARP family transcriptional regulator n=1 Tax=Streptomyces sp. NPDC015130 TaxID=3364940 RepID=UPI0036F852CA
MGGWFAVRFGLLGSFVVEDAEGTPRQIGTPKARALLAVLLLRGDATVSWDTVKAAIWGESVPATARASLHNHVARLRRDLDEGGDRIQVTPAGFRLRVRDDELDVTRFDRYLCRARTARLAEDWAEVEALTCEALALWRGAPLSDVPLPDTEREPFVRRVEEARLQVLEWGYEADLHLGRHQGIAAELAELVAAHPLRETFVGQLMLALHRSGRQADALLAYDTARRTIRRELGVDPEPGLVELHRRILTLDPALTAPRTTTTPRTPAAAPSRPDPDPLLTPSTDPTPAAPETHPGPHPGPHPATAPGPHPATALTPHPVPHQLPASPADFTGREQELDRIVGELAAADRPDGATVLVHRVSGSGGMGKTTLMVRAAHQIRERFPDGQIFLDLGGMTAMPLSPESALGLLLRTLGVAPEEVPCGLQARSALFRSLIARRRMLILLDDAGDAAQIRPLLPGAAGSAVLVTSRRRLVSFPGVRIDLGALPDDAAHRLLASIVGEDRVAAQPDATAEVLRACGGMPLALRLAGSRLAARPAWSVRDLAHRLTSHGRVLRELYADDLHVRTALQMSYELLLQESGGHSGPARAFRLLGLAPSGAFGTASAAALLDCDERSVEDWLEALVDGHLLESPAPGRYQFHCLLRELARELAEETDSEAERARAVERLVDWCLRGADAATARVAPVGRRVPLDPAPGRPVSFADYDEAHGWYERERDLLVAAVSLAHESGLHAQAWKLAASLWAYVRLGRSDDWLSTHTVGLAAARAAGDERAEAWMLNGLGNHMVQSGRPAEAITYYRRALDLHGGEPGRAAELSSVLNNLGTSFTHLGDHESALHHYQQSLLWEPDSCATLNNMADALAHLGRHDAALLVLDRAEEIQRATRDRVSLSIGLRVRGDVLRCADRPAEAVEAYRRALALQRLGGDHHSEAVSLTGLGDALADLGDLAEAEVCWEKAVHWMERLGDQGRTVELRKRLAAHPNP